MRELQYTLEGEVIKVQMHMNTVFKQQRNFSTAQVYSLLQLI